MKLITLSAIAIVVISVSAFSQGSFFVPAPIPHGADAWIKCDTRSNVTGAKLELKIVSFLGSPTVVLSKKNTWAGGDTNQIVARDSVAGGIIIKLTAGDTKNTLVGSVYYAELWMTKGSTTTRVAKGNIPMDYTTVDSSPFSASVGSWPDSTRVNDTLYAGVTFGVVAPLKLAQQQGVFTFDISSGYGIPTTTQASNWDAHLSDTNYPHGRDTTGQTNDPRLSNVEADVASRVPSTRSVSSGTGLTGGGDLSADRTLSLANTAVTPGSYTVSSITVDQQGRITSAASGRDTTGQVNDPRMSNIETDVASRVPSTRSVSAGTGLSGGGDLSADRTISLANTAVTAGSYTVSSVTVDQQGRITSAASGRDTTGQMNDPRLSNVEADVASKVPSTRSVSAGTGLSGGGDLSADRTLSLANTVTINDLTATVGRVDSLIIPQTVRDTIDNRHYDSASIRIVETCYPFRAKPAGVNKQGYVKFEVARYGAGEANDEFYTLYSDSSNNVSLLMIDIETTFYGLELDGNSYRFGGKHYALIYSNNTTAGGWQAGNSDGLGYNSYSWRVSVQKVSSTWNYIRPRVYSAYGPGHNYVQTWKVWFTMPQTATSSWFVNLKD